MEFKNDDLQALYDSGQSSNCFRPVLTISLHAKYLAMFIMSSGGRCGVDARTESKEIQEGLVGRRVAVRDVASLCLQV